MADESQAKGKLIGIDGRRIQRESLKMPVIEWNGRQYPIRILNEAKLFENDPKAVIMGLVTQNADQFQLNWIGLVALARDLYSRMPEGSREFEKLVQSMGLTLHDADRNPVEVEALLKTEGAPPIQPEPPTAA